MRCFLAVDVPEALKDQIVQAQAQIAGLDTKLVERENLHFTLKFLGETDSKILEKVVQKISRIKTGPINIRLKGIGYFPGPSFIRVVWLGAESQPFLDLHSTVNDVLEEEFQKEKPAPHLTLARVRSQKFADKIRAFGEAHKSRDFGSFACCKICLKKSTVTRKGPVYEDVKVFDLNDER